MLDPMADPSRKIFRILRIQVFSFFFFIELGQEVDDKIADIKNLAYDISTKLKSTSTNLLFELIFYF
jgi:hypothetical protein